MASNLCPRVIFTIWITPAGRQKLAPDHEETLVLEKVSKWPKSAYSVQAGTESLVAGRRNINTRSCRASVKSTLKIISKPSLTATLVFTRIWICPFLATWERGRERGREFLYFTEIQIFACDGEDLVVKRWKHYCVILWWCIIFLKLNYSFHLSLLIIDDSGENSAEMIFDN